MGIRERNLVGNRDEVHELHAAVRGLRETEHGGYQRQHLVGIRNRHEDPEPSVGRHDRCVDGEYLLPDGERLPTRVEEVD